MTSQRIAHLRISPLHIQQGLFAIFALLVTLVVGQQFGRWNEHHDPVQISQHIPVAHSYSTVSASPSIAMVQKYQSAQVTAPVTEQVHTQTWVF